jgi:eukaryotic-like serine/threonine-protein kinase
VKAGSNDLEGYPETTTLVGNMAEVTGSLDADSAQQSTATFSAQVESWLRAVAHLSATSSASPPRLRAGTRLCKDRFVVGSMLGRGGMGAVYEVRDLERNADLALKTLLDTRSQRLLAFKNEFRALQDIVHRNLVRLDELFEDDGLWFFTMERIHGEPFTTFVRPGGLDPDRLRKSLAQLAEGLLALHGAQKIHRDIKPSNTLVEQNGRVVLLDFGLIEDARSTKEARLPGVGTVAYMAPEQVAGDGGRPADWYGVGVMLYQALTGELPFDGPSRTVLNRKLVESPRPPSALAADVPPDLDRLCMDLLQREPARRPGGKEILARLDHRELALPRQLDQGTGAEYFVGRTRELELLRQTLARTHRGRPITAMISGESGIGKTALLTAFIGELKAPTTVLTGRCSEREFVPFKALDGLIDSLAHGLDQLDDATLLQLLPQRFRALARIFPVLGRVCRRVGLPADAADPVVSPTEARQNAFSALRELLFGLAKEGPVVLAIDDLHWADADSLAAIEDVLREPLPPNILLVLLARSGTKSPRVSGELVRIELEALLADEARELARCLLRGRRGPDQLDPEWLAEEAGRHPLFMEAMLRPGLAAGHANVRLEDALAERVMALPAAARAVIEVVSIAQPVSAAVLAQATGLSAEPLFKLIRDLQADRLILSRRDGTQSSIESYHDHVRRAVTGCMSRERQLSCHRSIAEALEIFAPERSEALTLHWRATGEADRARLHAIQAGHHARRALAFDRAASFYQTALDLHSGPAEDAAELHRLHAEALADSGRGPESAMAYRAAAELAAGPERTDLVRCAAEQLLRAGHIDEGLSTMDTVLASVGMTRPRSVAGAVRILVQERLLEACVSVVRRIVPLSKRRAAELGRRADACWTTGLGLAWLDPIAAAVFHSRYLRIARRLGDPARIALGLCLRAPEGTFSGAPATRALRTLEKVREIMRDRTDPFVDGYQALAAGAVAFLLGNWNEALLQSEHSLTLFREHRGGVAWEMATAERFVLDSLWHTGQIRALRERTWATWHAASRRGDRYAAVQVETTVLPVVHLANDDVEAASAILEGALSDRRGPGLSMHHWQHSQTHTLVELYAGRPSVAFRIMEAQVTAPEQALFSRIQAVRIFSSFLHASTLLGVALHQRRDMLSLVGRAERDIRRIDKERNSPETVALLRGQVELLRGNRAKAAAQLSSAEILFARKGMKLLSTVAAYGQGLATGGHDGQARMADAWRGMQAEEIRRPDGFVRLFAPGLGTR